MHGPPRPIRNKRKHMPVTFSFVIVGDSEPMSPPPSEQVVDAFVSKMAQEQPEEIPLLAQQLVQHGHQVLEQNDLTDERHHLARRLTEVKPDQMHHLVHLPFGCPMNRCLISASQEARVSEPCMVAMHKLEQVNEMEIQLEEQQEACILGYDVDLRLPFGAVFVFDGPSLCPEQSQP
jgi:hypothetical protein